ncbi:uncharacterized protein LOC106130507 isoform X2 [Amyelois transitella]|uniref:uncharacterized protein LOC106130507 isoform X2 n=1 Tax=Amyelois transitella TaxID=680683 RepID=UPI0029901216|nr:uncharacterized protein LOC106130507 isoform X2 [Amyelois transitella]
MKCAIVLIISEMLNLSKACQPGGGKGKKPDIPEELGSPEEPGGIEGAIKQANNEGWGPAQFQYFNESYYIKYMEKVPWKTGPAGEELWPGELCKKGKGTRQSPINIISANATRDLDMDFIKWGPLKFKNYQEPLPVIAFNNGNTLQFISMAMNGTDPTVTGGPLRKVYRLEQVHYHWPSEHAIDGHKALINTNHREYFSYAGSLSSPQCEEAVIWIVFETPLYVPETLYRAFGRLGVQRNNYRSMQALNQHKVYRTTGHSFLTPLLGDTFADFRKAMGLVLKNITRKAYDWSGRVAHAAHSSVYGEEHDHSELIDFITLMLNKTKEDENQHLRDKYSEKVMYMDSDELVYCQRRG